MEIIAMGDKQPANRCNSCAELLRSLRGIQLDVETQTADWSSTDVEILEILFEDLSNTAELYGRHLLHHYAEEYPTAASVLSLQVARQLA